MSKGKASTQQKLQQKPATTSIPAPFEKVSASLKPLLTQCDPAKVYLLHIDRHKVEYKRNIFLIPVIINGTIGLLLLWRIYVAAPTYWALILSVLGSQTSSAHVDPTSTTRRQQVYLVFRRAALILLDFMLFRLIGPWPLTFFAEQPANPVAWRWKLGFQAQEVIARVSRGWGSAELMQGQKKGAESAWYKTRIMPAIGKEIMQKTGYLTMDRSWDLDFALMLDAHTLVREGKIKIEDLDSVALAHIEEPTGWCQWRWERENSADEHLRRTVDRLKAELATNEGDVNT